MTLADKDPIRDLADRVVRDSLRFADHLRGLVSQVVPNLVDGFDFAQMRSLDRDFPVEDWRRREADVPFEVPYRLGNDLVPALVVVLIEHQSDTDPMMPLRLLYIAVVYWDQQWRAWEELAAPKPPFRLNPVLPIVVYTGATTWGSNRTLADLLGEPQAFHAFAPVWQPLFWNLAEQSAEELVSSDNNWLQLMAILRVEDADVPTFRDIFTRAVHQVKKIKEAEHVRWQALMQMMLTWVFWRRSEAERLALLAEVERAEVSVKRKGEIQQMVNKIGPTFVDLAMEKAMEKAMERAKALVKEEWREKGRVEGQEQGKLQSCRDILKTLLQDRFPRVPKKLLKQIDAVEDVEQLRQAIRRVSQCESITDFQL
jgi:hypothetical protein